MSAYAIMPEVPSSDLPVRRGRKTDTPRSDRNGEDLADNDPGTWTPCRGKEGDVETDKGDLDLDNGRVVRTDSTDDGDNELADHHTQRPVDEKWSSAESLDGPE